jgi:hypothetical protein
MSLNTLVKIKKQSYQLPYQRLILNNNNVENFTRLCLQKKLSKKCLPRNNNYSHMYLESSSSVSPPINYLAMPIHSLRFIDPHHCISTKIIPDMNDDVNRLIKKLALSFTAKKHEAQFFINIGVFQGTQFNLVTNDQNLSLRVSHASEFAVSLLNDYRDLLKNRLSQHEINLCEIRFIF